MHYNSGIHEGFKDMGKSNCPFCDKLLAEVNENTKVVESCCEKQNIIKDNKKNVCLNCGLVYGYDYVNEYINFHENMHKIRRKSVYHRKYHIENVLNTIIDNNMQLTHENRTKIIKIFKLINGILPKINHNRKRIISVRYITKQIFELLKLDINVKITKCPKTLDYYNKWWSKVLILITNEIRPL